ncbi:YciI family protein [Devosia sp.]|uniref:YciI family protein n=1 Tax=Devosia sp. TaxID=1871048 RepID=UPI002FC8AEBA
MLILLLTYIAPLDQVDQHVEAHMVWVKQGYERGWFLASGRKDPRTGGVILARGDRSEIEAYIATDPFMISGVTRYDVTEVVLSRAAPGLEGLLP